MNWAVQVVQNTDISNKWELAQRLSDHAEAPEQALKSIFTRAMQCLEVVGKTTFETSMKERVWNTVSGEKLKTLKQMYIIEVCEKILRGFSNKEAAEMLEEHNRTGAVKNLIYSSQLQMAFAYSKESIFNALVKRANAITKEWMPEIVSAVNKELPDAK